MSLADNNRSKRKDPKPLKPDGEAQAADFAITTINFPDRLDAREMDDRKIEDDDPNRSFRVDSYAVRLWLKRLAAVAVLGALVYVALVLVRPFSAAIAPAELSARLTKALGHPVEVAKSGFRATPSPRMVLDGITIDNDLKLDELALLVNWTSSWQAVQGARWTGGEAVVGPARLTVAQGQMLLGTLAGLSTGLPTGISIVRFADVVFTDAPLLPAHYEVTARREPDNHFASVEVRELTSEGSMLLKLSPLPAVAGAAAGSAADAVANPAGTPANAAHLAFQLDAANWKAPIGGNVHWTDISITGTVAPMQIDADYSISAFYGVTRGSISATMTDHWELTGKATSANLDLEAIVGQAIGRDPSKIEKGDTTLALGGTAALTAVLSGQGATLDEALHALEVNGPVDVRWGVLNGINLGFAATRPSPPGTLLQGRGGNTRFTDLSATLVANAAGIAFHDINGRAGAMSARGQLKLAPDNTLDGALRVDLGESRVQAPLNLGVHGTLEKPLYGT